LNEKVTRLYPLPAEELPGEGIYEDLELPPEKTRDPSRPYVIINMVSSVDGRAALERKSTRIGSETDRWTMRTLRSKADAVMIGAGTLRAERLSLGLDDPDGPQPLAVIATSSGDIPLERNLIAGEGQHVLVIASEHVTVRSGEHGVLRLAVDGSGHLDLGLALEILKAEHAVDLLLVEGGPRLNHSLVSQNLADELFLTLAPKLLGGTGSGSSTICEGSTLPTRRTNLLSVHLAGDELFLRYDLRARD
jgi:riboflavin-specific deaminase-like protein